MHGTTEALEHRRNSLDAILFTKELKFGQTPHSKKFVESLNDFLFSVVKVVPNPQDAGLPKFEVFFDDICFDMSGQEPVIQKYKTKK